MSRVTYNADTLTLTVDDHGIAKALGELKSKTPAVLKVAINSTARQAVRDIKKSAKRRYDLTARGVEKTNAYKQKKKATNKDLSAVLNGDDDGIRLNMAYFKHDPDIPRMGREVSGSPKTHRYRVVKSEGWKPLEAGDGKSKGFLVSIANQSGNDHIAMLQRVLGSKSKNVKTRRGYFRWASASGEVEKVWDVYRPSASSMGVAVWERGVDNIAAENLEKFVDRRINQILEKAARKG